MGTESSMKRVRVMIVEDSLVIREFLTYVIERDPRLQIVAAVSNGEAALRALQRSAPDVISMDVRMPGMDGIETTRRIMAERPTPIVIVAANVNADEQRISINALRAGALTVLEKPTGGSREALEAFSDRVCTQLAIMSQVRVITQRPASPVESRVAADTDVRPTSAGPCRIVGIVASTGGPNALATVLGELPADFPVPILLVQHITSCFSDAFIDWLGSVCRVRVQEAAAGVRPEPGTIYVAPADHHLIARPRGLYLEKGSLVCMHRPSGSVLFQSMAETYGAGAVGVLLTGMGEDGASGLLEMRRAGGRTIAEHESTAVVYGMPAAAVKLGAACEVLALPRIGRRLRQLTHAPGLEVAV